MLLMHDVALDDVKRPQHHTKYCHMLVQNLTLNHYRKSYIRLQTSANMAQNIYSCIIKGLLH